MKPILIGKRMLSDEFENLLSIKVILIIKFYYI